MSIEQNTALSYSSSKSFIHSFIHFGHFYSVPTTQRRSRLQHGYCIGVSRRSAQATAGNELAQGLYVAARAGVEPTTLQLKVIVSTKAPPCPTIVAMWPYTIIIIFVYWKKPDVRPHQHTCTQFEIKC